MGNDAAEPWIDNEIGRPTRARQLLQSARARLDEVAQLPDDWDSYGAARPTTEAFATAHDLLTGLWDGLADTVDQRAVQRTVAPLADGGIQFEWRGPGGAIEVEIAPQGAFNYLVERDERTIRRSDPNRGASRDEVVGQIRLVLAWHEKLTLSARESAAFVEALLDPPAPGERLRAAARAHRDLIGE